MLLIGRLQQQTIDKLHLRQLIVLAMSRARRKVLDKCARRTLQLHVTIARDLSTSRRYNTCTVRIYYVEAAHTVYFFVLRVSFLCQSFCLIFHEH